MSTSEAIEEEAARSLIADGRFLEAIEVLSALNRRQRDPGLECRLVHLRHEAWRELSAARAPAATPWPRALPPLPLEDGVLPEVGFGDLSADLLQTAVFNHGAVLVRNMLPTDRIEQLTEDIRRTMEAVRSLESGGSVGDAPEWFTPFETPGFELGLAGRMWVISNGTVWLPDAPRTMFDLIDTLDEVGLTRVISEVFGCRPAVSATKFALREVPPDAEAAWHQDSFLGAGTRTINVWITLSDCGPDAPGLDILPRRLDEFVDRPYDPPVDYVVAQETVDELAVATPVVRPHFHPGDALIFDQWLLHQTGWGPGLSRPRYGFECWFFDPSTYPDGNTPLVV